jgi:hypothetical protein
MNYELGKSRMAKGVEFASKDLEISQNDSQPPEIVKFEIQNRSVVYCRAKTC